MSVHFLHNRQGHGQKTFSGDTLPSLRNKFGSSSTKAVSWLGHQIRRARRASSSDNSDATQPIWGTSTEIYEDEVFKSDTTLAEEDMAMHQSQWETPQTASYTDEATYRSWDSDLSSEPRVGFGSFDSNVPIIQRSPDSPSQKRRKQNKCKPTTISLHPSFDWSDSTSLANYSIPHFILFELNHISVASEGYGRMLEPIQLSDRPWSGEFTDPFANSSASVPRLEPRYEQKWSERSSRPPSSASDELSIYRAGNSIPSIRSVYPSPLDGEISETPHPPRSITDSQGQSKADSHSFLKMPTWRPSVPRPSTRRSQTESDFLPRSERLTSKSGAIGMLLNVGRSKSNTRSLHSRRKSSSIAYTLPPLPPPSTFQMILHAPSSDWFIDTWFCQKPQSCAVQIILVCQKYAKGGGGVRDW